MVLAGEAHKAHRDPVGMQCGVPLLGLLDGAAVVEDRVHDQGGRLDVLDVRERRQFPELQGVGASGEIEPEFVVPEAQPDIGGAAEGQQVADRAVGDRRLEPLGVPGEPVGHEAAVAAAHHGGLFAVQARHRLQAAVEEIE